MSPACELWLDADAASLRRRLPPAATLEDADGGGSTVRLDAELDDVARLLGGLGVPFAVHAPDELRDAVARLGSLLMASALRDAPATQ